MLKSQAVVRVLAFGRDEQFGQRVFAQHWMHHFKAVALGIVLVGGRKIVVVVVKTGVLIAVDVPKRSRVVYALGQTHNGRKAPQHAQEVSDLLPHSPYTPAARWQIDSSYQIISKLGKRFENILALHFLVELAVGWVVQIGENVGQLGG